MLCGMQAVSICTTQLLRLTSLMLLGAMAQQVAAQMIFGNFAQGGILAYFGGIDLLVDPYSDAGTAQIALHVNRFFDFDLRQPGALATATKVAA